MSPMTRYPFAPLAALMGCTEASAARRLNISGKTEQQYRREGLSAKVADRMAVRAGYHPYEVWPEMIERDLEDVESARRATNAERRRKYRSTKRGAEATRRANRKHYAENSAYYKDRQALWRANNKDNTLLYNRAYNAQRDPEKRRQQGREATRRWRERIRSVSPLAHDRPMQDEEAA